MIIKKYPVFDQFFTKNRFVTNIIEKAELFNSFFAKQCSIIDNGREIPSFLLPKNVKLYQISRLLKRV